MTITGYLSVVADSDLFGLLAIYCLVIAMTGLFEKPRNSRTYRVLAFLGLMSVPALHAIGTYFLNQLPA